MITSPKKLRQRIRWLRKREKELLGRVYGPRYPHEEGLTFIGHIGEWDAYIHLDQNRIIMISKQDYVNYPIKRIHSTPGDFPLELCALALFEEQQKESDLTLELAHTS